MKIELHLLKYGNKTDWMRLCVPTIEAYAKRHDLKVVTWDDNVAKEKGYPAAKFAELDMVESFLAGKADFMIYMDLDVWVHPEAPLPPLKPGLSMATDCYHAEHQAQWEDWFRETYGPSPFGPHRYSNAGIWIVDRKGANKLREAMCELRMVEFFLDQHWFNAVASHARAMGIPFNQLSSEWNRGGKDHEPAWFRHFWGTDKVADYEEFKASGMLHTKPDGLRYSVHPGHTPHQDKVFYLQFVKNCGLGNQLFEMAAGINIARKLGIPLRWQYQDTGYREFGLKHFGFGILPFREVPVVCSKLGQGNYAMVDKSMHRITDTGHKVCAVANPYQAEECFADVADEIREIFKLDPLPLDVPAGKIPVAVQVRRGDYVGHPRLNVCTEGYYQNAIDWMRAKIPASHFFIVSDDPEWCRKTFGKLPDVTVMPPQEAIDGLRTMVACDAHVISNSTFGWWGAWLGEKGPVVVPEIWHHKPGSYGDWKPAPDRWIKVPVTRHREGGIPAANLTGLRSQRIQYDRAILYPWHQMKDKWGKSLYYSLRSLEQHFEDKDCPIFILGTAEPHRLLKNSRIKFLECWGYESALMQGLAIAEKSLWMNDDILFLKDTSWADVEKPLHFGPVTPELRRSMIENSNPWKQGYLRMLDLLAAEGVTEPFHYSTHTPYVFRRAEVMEVFEKFGCWSKMALELAVFNLFPKDGMPCNGHRTQTTDFGDARYLNHTDHLLTDELKEAIEARWPNPAKFEVKAPF